MERKEFIEIMKQSKAYDEFENNVYKYILYRLALPDQTKEQSIYYLVLYSVRLKMPDEDVKTLESRLSTVDCHQTSYIVSKKTLLMMEIEKELGASIDYDDLDKSDNVKYYANVLWSKIHE